MITLIWLIIGICLEFQDPHKKDKIDLAEWAIVVIPALLIDAIGIAITCGLFPKLSLCGCS